MWQVTCDGTHHHAIYWYVHTKVRAAIDTEVQNECHSMQLVTGGSQTHIQTGRWCCSHSGGAGRAGSLLHMFPICTQRNTAGQKASKRQVYWWPTTAGGLCISTGVASSLRQAARHLRPFVVSSSCPAGLISSRAAGVLAGPRATRPLLCCNATFVIRPSLPMPAYDHEPRTWGS